MSGANYGGRQTNNTAYIKQFRSGLPASLFKITNHDNLPAITPTSNLLKNLYIPGNLYVDGSLTLPSDAELKDNILGISEEISENIMKLSAKEFTLKNDNKKTKHYGFIAQELEMLFPNLVTIKPDINGKKYKGVNYLELIPLLVHKIQEMQQEIDQLKDTLLKN